MASQWPIEAVSGGTREELLEDVSWEDYCALPAMNPSTLVKGLLSGGEISVKHLRHAWEQPDQDSDAKRWGRAVHCLLFEPLEIGMRFASWRGESRRTKAYRDFLKQVNEAGMEILTGEQYDAALEAAKSFVDYEPVQRLINGPPKGPGGKAEVTLLAVEEGIQCRGRVDWIASGTALVDLKTTRDVSARAFGRDFYKFHYDVKLGLYRRWLNRITARNWPVQVVCVQNTAPYDVTIVPIADAVLDRGAEKGLEVIKALREALDTGEWPGVAKGEEYFLDVPYHEMSDELEGVETIAA